MNEAGAGTKGEVVVDAAGAVMGGALRFVQELDGYLVGRMIGVRQLGRGRRVNLRWLAQREVRAGRCEHTVALNNISFVGAGHMKTVLLRNALHFLSASEQEAIDIAPAFRAQTAIVRTFVAHADRIVVPTSSMADRVCRTKPRAADRVVVMHHPVSLLPPSPRRDGRILCPVLDAPYKKLGKPLADIISGVQALRDHGEYGQLELFLTLTGDEAATLRLPLPAFVRLLGRLTPDALRGVQQSAHVIFYPTTLESFGYPLAEAQLGRQPVIAPPTHHAREVAGDALVPYSADDNSSLVDALRRALQVRLPQLAENPFDPEDYFDRLFLAS